MFTDGVISQHWIIDIGRKKKKAVTGKNIRPVTGSLEQLCSNLRSIADNGFTTQLPLRQHPQLSQSYQNRCLTGPLARVPSRKVRNMS